MTTFTDFIQTYDWIHYDAVATLSAAETQADSALAYDEAFVRWILDHNESQSDSKPISVIHTYPIDRPTVILGPKDSRLPKLDQGIAYLEDYGYQVALRPHGGLAVIADSGILNVSLVSDSTFFPLSIDEGYQLMVDWVQASLAPEGITVESYEIVHSYCPGKYDLVVDGLKIGGIAQRRFKTGVAIAAYIGVNGNQTQRGEAVGTFYRISDADDSYPLVQPESMTTLSDVLGRPLTVQAYQDQLHKVIASQSHVTTGDYSDVALQDHYEKLYQKALHRSYRIHSGE